MVLFYFWVLAQGWLKSHSLKKVAKSVDLSFLLVASVEQSSLNQRLTQGPFQFFHPNEETPSGYLHALVIQQLDQGVKIIDCKLNLEIAVFNGRRSMSHKRVDKFSHEEF